MPKNHRPLFRIGGKTCTTGYLASIHLESFWRNQLKITDHRTNWKGEHSTKRNFSDWTQNYLLDWHTAGASITQVAPVGVSSRWKSQITARMIRFGSLLSSSFFVFPFRGCGLRENYFWLQRGFYSRQLIRTAPCCGWGGKCFPLNLHNQEVVQW
jgi:hypothetical protein